MDIRKKAMQIANRLRAKMDGSTAMRKGWQIAKVIMGYQKTCAVKFQKKCGTITSRIITSIQGNYTFKGSSKKPTTPTLLKVVDFAKQQAGQQFNIISFHIGQILA